MKNEPIFVKVRMSKANKQKTVTIPKSAKHIKEGDYVKIEKTK